MGIREGFLRDLILQIMIARNASVGELDTVARIIDRYLTNHSISYMGVRKKES